MWPFEFYRPSKQNFLSFIRWKTKFGMIWREGEFDVMANNQLKALKISKNIGLEEIENL